jgi:hypothetical protein
VSYLRRISALLCFALCNSAAFGCGPLAANAVFVVEPGTPPPGKESHMMLYPLGKWNAQTRNLESFHPEMNGPEIDWMPAQLYTDCDYRLYDSRGRFVRVIHVDRWHYNEEDAGAYVMPGIADLPVDADSGRYIATNVPTVRESPWVLTQLTHRQYVEAAKRVIPEYLKVQSAQGDGQHKPGPGDFAVSAFRLGERVLSWWIGSAVKVATVVEFGAAITLQSFPQQPEPLLKVNYAGYAPSFVFDIDGDGETEFLIETMHSGGGGFLILSMRDGQWVASAEARTGGC